MKKMMVFALGLVLLAGGSLFASDNATLSLGNTRSQNQRWAVRLLAIDGQAIEKTAVASHQRVFTLSPGTHTLRLARWWRGTGSRLGGSARESGRIRDLEVTVEAGGQYRVEGTGRGSSWEPTMVAN
jgi:hypothetical protein